MTREPAVSGQFYPSDPDELRFMIAEYTPSVEQRQKVLGALSPHAGYVFCGATAAAVFGRIEVPPAVILLNPSHHYYSPACALWTGGAWQTPLGQVQIHKALTDALAELMMVTPDNRPHYPEHSGEVVVPFLQYHRPDVRIAVICIASSADLSQVMDLGQGIKEAIEASGEPAVLVVASSDMSHEDGHAALKVVNKHDPMAIEQMEKLDPEGLVRTARSHNITMCGVLPAAAMMASVRARGGTRGELVHRATSADSPHGRGTYVVGYAGMIFR